MRLKDTPVEGTESRNPRRLPDNPEDFKATLAEHIDELRQRIVRSLLFLTVGWVVGWFVQPWLYTELQQLVQVNIAPILERSGGKYDEVFTNAVQPFMLKLKMSFLIGLVMAFPLIVVQVWGFIKPGLKPNERKPVERAAPVSVFLFALGCFFCWLVLPATLKFFASFFLEFQGTSLFQEPGTMVLFILRMMLAFGIGFQLPLVVYALGAMNLLSAQTLIKNWRQASIAIFILSAILTPSADAVSMMMMALPMVLLFMISVYAVKVTQRRRKILSNVDEPVE
jgi:sec-independent protein translocase protein TatC